MASGLQSTPSDALRQIHRIQTITIGWMILEAGVSLWAAGRAKSPALLAFGGDSAIELLSAVVLWRFRRNAPDENTERRAARIAGVLLLILTVYVVAASAATLLGYSEARQSLLGIIVLIAAAIIMPWLAQQKWRLSALTGSASLRADAAESMLCAYLSLTALLGLAAHQLLGVAWADPVAALAVTPLIAWEARQAFVGQACSCC
jgi:divalent metal cation (Fe/Co/Zn/Cd) transporter